MDNLSDRFWEWASTVGVRIVAIVLGAFILYLIVRTASRRLLHVARKVGEKSEFVKVTREQEMRAATMAGIVRGMVVVVLVMAVMIMVLRELGYDVGLLIAGAGIVGIALGFGAQTLVKDLIGGFFILLEGQFYVGDIIQVGLVEGKVEAIKLRTTLIRDAEGILHIIPNGEMRVVANHTKGWSQVNLDFTVDYREDLPRVMDIIAEAARKTAAPDSPVAGYITQGPKVLGVEEMTGGTVTIRVVARTAPFQDPQVAREIRREVAMALGQQKITMAGSEKVAD